MGNWWTELVKIVAEVLIGVILTDAFPSIKGFFRKGSLSFNSWRIKLTKERYFDIKNYSKNHSTLAVRSIKYLAKEIANIVILFLYIGLVILYSTNPVSASAEKPKYGTGVILIAIFTGVILANLSDIVQVIENAFEFEKYKEKTKARLKKLGGTSEDLDKMDKEFEETETDKVIKKVAANALIKRRKDKTGG